MRWHRLCNVCVEVRADALDTNVFVSALKTKNSESATRLVYDFIDTGLTTDGVIFRSSIFEYSAKSE